MQYPIALNSSLVRNRALALVDIENLAGTPLPSTGLVQEIKSAFCSLAVMNPMSQTYVGCHPGVTAEVCFGWHDHFTLCSKAGKDGADLALIEEVHNIKNLREYNTIVIGSGDHIFAGIAEQLRKEGHYIHVIVGNGHPSAALRGVAHKVSYLPHFKI